VFGRLATLRLGEEIFPSARKRLAKTQRREARACPALLTEQKSESLSFVVFVLSVVQTWLLRAWEFTTESTECTKSGAAKPESARRCDLV
jgi:hypothetical protein